MPIASCDCEDLGDGHSRQSSAPIATKVRHGRRECYRSKGARLFAPVALQLGLAALGVAGVETAAPRGYTITDQAITDSDTMCRAWLHGDCTDRAFSWHDATEPPTTRPGLRGGGDRSRWPPRAVAVDISWRDHGVRPVAVLRPEQSPTAACRRCPAAGAGRNGAWLAARSNPSQPGAGRVPPQVPPPSWSVAGHASTAPLANAPYAGSHRRLLSRHRPRGLQMHRDHWRDGARREPAHTDPASAPERCSNSRSHAGTKPGAAPSAAATAPVEVPEAAPAPNRVRPNAPAAAAASAAAASASAKAATPSAAANTSPATGSASSAAAAKTEPRPPTTLVPVAPLD
jgi:hypothetical protein